MDYALLSIKWPLASLAAGVRAVLTCLGALLGPPG